MATAKTQAPTAKAALLAACALAACALAACGGGKEQTKVGEKTEAAASPASGPTEAVQQEVDGNTVIERIDVNADQKPDVFKYYRLVEEPKEAGQEGVKSAKKALIRKELDVNFDQRIDIVQYYSGESSKEVLVREEMDLDFDGRVDSTRHYQDGNVTLVEMDLGFDGKVDSWSYFQMTTGEDGKPVNRLVERRRDENGDGNVDKWEYYVKGNLNKIGTDTNGDGQPDQYTRVDEKR